ncbi:protodermal factor 1 [Lactuca sativa]|uniref:Protodermal factor 1 n=1 Tax=Lactuca sativa TaxID=4236 RepID=A0A9R1W892_LACSA|nr:protodermal factor 1 [Lactuca sativa]KAJ0219178.1 hypothetical protein LSAT_V11C300115970 [Lactuca sativa]
MKRTRGTQSTCLLVWGLVAALLSQNLVFPAFSATFQDEKNFFYFPPYPGVVASPPVVIPTPPIVDPSPPLVPTPPIVDPSPPIGYSNSPPPTHGSGGSTPPAHHTPSHGSGSSGDHHGHGGTPPKNCGNPTPHHSPPKHVDPSPPHHNPSPATPTYHYSPPPSGGGGGGNGGNGGNGGSGGPGGSGGSGTPPTVLPPTTPGLPYPSPPFDPNSPPSGGTCDFWRNHPGVIWGLFGWWGTTVGTAFGVTTLPGTGAHLNLVQALSNTRTDGIGALYREGTASLLNSMVNKNFPYTTSHVKDSFVAAVGSNKAAAAQARVFKLANEGHMKLRN